ncbi:9951_t:CDS:1 [Paraglomus occultum]|uniref:Phosphatidylglycerol/phosphatidylinositol transfer protein n=1 Tax=Paraglomus occultum TaxID=144539 RepID=A0A9N9G5T5_9GLOM|nr:9951_t:CDS:1 [Paraglomus occultum]
MNRNLLFFFFFLALISVINASKKATKFEPCPPIKGNPVDMAALTVSVSPNPIASRKVETYTVSGTALEDIPTDAEFSITYNYLIGGRTIGLPDFARFCAKGNNCPVKKGDKFNRTITAKARKLPKAFNATLVINTIHETYACAVATIQA